MRSNIAIFVIVFAILGLLLGFANSFDVASPSDGPRFKASGGFQSASPSSSTPSDSDEGLLQEGILYRDYYGGAVYFTKVIDIRLEPTRSITYLYEDTRPEESQNANLRAYFYPEDNGHLQITGFGFPGPVDILAEQDVGEVPASGEFKVVSLDNREIILHVRIFSVYDQSTLGNDININKLPNIVSDIAMDRYYSQGT